MNQVSAIQAAKEVGVNSESIKAASRRGELPSKLSGGRLLFKLADLKRWAEQRGDGQ